MYLYCGIKIFLIIIVLTLIFDYKYYKLLTCWFFSETKYLLPEDGEAMRLLGIILCG